MYLNNILHYQFQEVPIIKKAAKLINVMKSKSFLTSEFLQYFVQKRNYNISVIYRST